jgi:hypothetical protein
MKFARSKLKKVGEFKVYSVTYKPIGQDDLNFFMEIANEVPGLRVDMDKKELTIKKVINVGY